MGLSRDGKRVLYPRYVVLFFFFLLKKNRGTRLREIGVRLVHPSGTSFSGHEEGEKGGGQETRERDRESKER